MGAWTLRLSIAATMIFLAASAARSADVRPEVGRVDKIEGSAEAFYVDQVRSLAEGSPVYLDDRLSTDNDARLRVNLTDGTELTLGENADLVVDTFVYDPSVDEGALLVETLKGAFLFVGGLVENKSGAVVKVRTPVATLGIRGTTVWGGPIDGQFGVLVLDGAVTVSNAAGSVNLTEGMGTSLVQPTTGPSDSKRWPDQKVTRAVATVSFAE